MKNKIVKLCQIIVLTIWVVVLFYYSIIGVWLHPLIMVAGSALAIIEWKAEQVMESGDSRVHAFVIYVITLIIAYHL